MHKTIILNGRQYELQITARELINNGYTSVSMSKEEDERLKNEIADKIFDLKGAVDYAAEQRAYESEQTSDDEDSNDIERCAKQWEALAEELDDFLRS